MAGVQAGMMRSIQIPAGVLPARSAQVYTPAGYVNGTPVAFMVFHDGGAYVNNFRIPVIFDNLIAAKKIPPMVGIFIPPSGNRSGEYDTVSDRFGRYVITDVFPQVERLGIKLTTDPDAAGAGGHSSGGICAFTMAWFHPDRFRRVLSNSGSFLRLQNPGGDMYDALIRGAMPKKPIRTAMTVGTMDLSGQAWYNASERQYKALSEMGYNVRYIVINGGTHDQGSPMPTTPDLIEWLWRGYPVTGPTR
jgi:enterochelin esterase-like enzyme